jgi:hypothetical protein
VRPGGGQPRGERGRHNDDGTGRQHIGAGCVGRGQRVRGRRRQRLQRDEIKDGIERRGAAKPVYMKENVSNDVAVEDKCIRQMIDWGEASKRGEVVSVEQI